MGGLPKKRLGQFVNLRGAWQERGDGVFDERGEGGDTPMHTMKMPICPKRDFWQN